MVAHYAQLLVPAFWLGMVVAISFLEAPIKFRAPGVTLPIGLGIGRLVFKALNGVEIFLTLTLWISCIFVRTAVAGPILLASATIVLLIQVFAVRPPLSRRSDRVLAGETVPHSQAHWVYIGLELVKVGVLVAMAVIFSTGVIG